MSAFDGEFNESTQHLLILADEEVCGWRGMHGHGSRRSRRLSSGSAGGAVNVWRTSPARLRGGTRAAHMPVPRYTHMGTSWKVPRCRSASCRRRSDTHLSPPQRCDVESFARQSSRETLMVIKADCLHNAGVIQRRG